MQAPRTSAADRVCVGEERGVATSPVPWEVVIQNVDVSFWVHKDRAHRGAKVHRTTCLHCDCGEAGCTSFHSYTAAWRSASASGFEASNCRVCRPED